MRGVAHTFDAILALTPRIWSILVDNNLTSTRGYINVSDMYCPRHVLSERKIV